MASPLPGTVDGVCLGSEWAAQSPGRTYISTTWSAEHGVASRTALLFIYKQAFALKNSQRFDLDGSVAAGNCKPPPTCRASPPPFAQPFPALLSAMKSLSQIKDGVAASFRTDPTINRVRGWVGPASRRLPSATAEYLAEKLPVAQWLPHYDPRWLLRDLIAGVTVGVMLIPQGLAYAKIATVPIANGLYASWFPPLLYFFLGTSRELSAGPTSILGLLTAEAVEDLSRQGYRPADISAAMAFMVGVYALAVGLLKLGFLLDFVSAPVLTGWISAVAIVIGLGQVGSLVGLDLPPDVPGIIHGFFAHIRGVKPLTLAIGLTGLAFLLVLEQVGKRNKRGKYVKFVCTSRAVILLVVYTLISYLCNRGRGTDLLWAVTKVDTHGLPAPRPHDPALLKKVAVRAFAPLIAMSVEHLGVGKAFGLRGDYSIDKSQELVFLGVNNMVNSLFGAQATGGAMSRTAVNSDCNVHSPVNFLFTGGLIVLTLYELAPALYWIPKATLSAIIVGPLRLVMLCPRCANLHSDLGPDGRV